VHLVVRQWLGWIAVVAVALTLPAQSASAQTADPCIGDGVGVEAKGDAFASLRLIDHLETAWLADDANAALELFTDDAVAASSSGERWQGTVELADFLHELWDPAQSGEHQRIETLNQCAIGDRAVALPVPDAGRHRLRRYRVPRRISHVFWQFVPPAIGSSDADNDRTRIDSGLNTGPSPGPVVVLFPGPNRRRLQPWQAAVGQLRGHGRPWQPRDEGGGRGDRPP
jgi:hypothetical protein